MQLDTAAQEELRVLKEEKIPSKLGSRNIFDYDVPWSDEEGGGVNTTEHGDYLKEFGETMEREIIRLIEAGLKKTNKGVNDPLHEEILEHAHQAVKKCDRFHGREEVSLKETCVFFHIEPLLFYSTFV